MAATHGPASISQDQEFRPAPAQRPNGASTAVLGIGTANPANCLRQDEYAGWCFRVTKSDHLTSLKNKMKRICEKSGIKKRHFHYTEQMIAEHPEFLDRAAPSLDARLGITQDAVAELAVAAAARAIVEWGRPATDITHLVVTTNSSAHAPGADLRLAALLGLRPTVQHTLLYLHGCFGGCSALRIAKDLAENNRGARVLVVSSEVGTLLHFRAPDQAHLDELVAMALFGDGAGAAIIAAGDPTPIERPIFYLVSASQATLPGTEHALTMQLGTAGMEPGISAEVPAILQGTINGCLADMLAPLGVPVVPGADWNSLFWAVHPGGRAILDSCEAALTLDAGKLAASRHVLNKYGNMFGATVFFVLDEVRHRRQDGDCEWGVMMGIGPGITVEMMVLQLEAASSQGRKC